MAKYYVTLPVTGSLGISDIEADSEEEAIKKALDTPYDENNHELMWNQTDKIVEGNVFYGEINEAEAELEEE